MFTFPIVKNVSNRLISDDMTASAPTVGKIESSIRREQIIIEGGRAHVFGEGWVNLPYKLVRVLDNNIKYKSQVLSINIRKEIVVLEGPYDTLTPEMLADWKKKCVILSEENL